MTRKNLICALLVLAVTATALSVFIAHKRANLKAQRVEQSVPEKEAEIEAKTAHDAVENTKLARQRALRELPPDIDSLLKCLSYWGYWTPGETSMKDGKFYVANARSEGASPAKHSYRTLTSAGALEDDVQGYVTLYIILASEADKERGRKTDGGISISVNEAQSWLSYQGGDLGAVFTTSDAARRTLKEMRELQRILREYRIELIAQGLLAE